MILSQEKRDSAIALTQSITKAARHLEKRLLLDQAPRSDIKNTAARIDGLTALLYFVGAHCD